MKLIFNIITILLVQVSFAQNDENRINTFLSDVVFGDSINLTTLQKKPINIDTSDLFLHLSYERHSKMELAVYDTIKSFLDTASASLKKNIVDQIQTNNDFHWKDLNVNHFVVYKKRKKGKSLVNYSLPIFYSSNKALVYHSWSFDSLYAGSSVDFWEYKSGIWVKIKSETLWMS